MAVTALRRWRRLSPAEKALARRRADEAFDELETWMVERVRLAFQRTFAGVTNRLGAAQIVACMASTGDLEARHLTAAGPEGFISPDELNVIPTAWVNEVQTTLLPAVDELYQTGGLTALVQFGPAVVARQVAEGVDALEDVLERRGLEFLEGSENRLRNIGETAWEDARDGLAEGFRLGESVDEIARRVQKAIEVSLDRAVTIARTETTRAVNAGQLDTVKALGEHGPQFKEWLCLAGSAKVAGRVEAVSRRWESGPLVRLRTVPAADTSAGRLSDTTPTESDLTVTPDHLLLSRRGWVRAKDVESGDDLIGASLDQRHGWRNPYVKGDPPSIEEVFTTAAQAHPAQRVMAVSPHLDGKRPDCDVDVVPIDGLLRDRLLAAVPQPFGEQFLSFSDTELALLTEKRPGSDLFLGRRSAHSTAATDGSHSGVAVLAPPHDSGLRFVSQDDAAESQVTFDGIPAASFLGGESPNRRPFGIASHEVIAVEVIEGGRHVYDLSTSVGWFLAEGKIVHNSTNDARTRPEHGRPPDGVDGTIVPINDPFLVGGEEMDAPGDGSAAMSCNCRCTLLYVDDGPDPLIAALEEPVTVTEPEAIPEATAVGRTFETLLTVEGRWTGDARVIMADALWWDGMLPFPLTIGHTDDPAAAVGLVTEIERRPGPNPDERLLIGTGIFDDAKPEAAEIIRQIEVGTVRGVSIDIDSWVLGGVDPDEKPDDPQPARDVLESARLRALALTSLPAFAEAYITLDVVDVANLPPPPDPDAPTPLTRDEMPGVEDRDDEESVVVLASGAGYRVVAAAPAADAPPFEWFTNPKFDGPCPFTITDDGQVFGHIALWGVCHTGISGVCTVPPRSASGYAGFLLGEVLCSDGSRVPVGKITVGGGHAAKDWDWRTTVDHYDNSATAVCDVFCGEDDYGIWTAGAVRPTAAVADIAALRASPPSGDWRRMGNRLELVAALGVNVPGFPVPRVRAMVADGRQMSLVAAGALDPSADYKAEARIAAAERIARTIGRDRHSLVSALICRVHPDVEG